MPLMVFFGLQPGKRYKSDRVRLFRMSDLYHIFKGTFNHKIRSGSGVYDIFNEILPTLYGEDQIIVIIVIIAEPCRISRLQETIHPDQC